MYLLGEALDEAHTHASTPSAAADATSVVSAIRRRVKSIVASGEEDPGAKLREALPRAIAVRCGTSTQPVFTDGGAGGVWRTRLSAAWTRTPRSANS